MEQIIYMNTWSVPIIFAPSHEDFWIDEMDFLCAKIQWLLLILCISLLIESSDKCTWHRFTSELMHSLWDNEFIVEIVK